MEPVLNETPLTEKPIIEMPATTPISLIAKHQKQLIHCALILAIAVALNTVVVVAISLAYPAPLYTQYCEQVAVTPLDSSTCNAKGGVWVDYAPEVPSEARPELNGVCDMYAKCALQYQTANDTHAFYFLILLIAIGLIAIALKSRLQIQSALISSSLFCSGVFAIVLGIFAYWGTANNWVRFSIAIIGLTILLYVRYRRIHK